ncbi:hypothetical+protein [Methylocapsa aurea]
MFLPPDDRDKLSLIMASACAALAAVYCVKILALILYAARWGAPD